MMFVYVMLGAGGFGLIDLPVYCKPALETWRSLNATTKDYDNLTTGICVVLIFVLPAIGSLFAEFSIAIRKTKGN